MHRTESRWAALAIILAALAGFVDALAFTSFGAFFASFMSGNTTRLGAGIGGGSAGDAIVAGALILCFVSGVIVATVVDRAAGPARRQPAVMAVVTLLLLAAAVVGTLVPQSTIALLLLASAMGCENGMFQRNGEVSIGVTYMTGTLVKLGQKLAAALIGEPGRFDWVPYLALWSGFLAGAVSGAASQRLWGWNAVWLAAAIAGLLTLVVARFATAGRGGPDQAA